MAFTVRVYDDDAMIIETHAQCIEGSPGQPCTYKDGSGRIIEQNYDDGSVELAIKLLEELL